jgi:hypothetical protein
MAAMHIVASVSLFLARKRYGEKEKRRAFLFAFSILLRLLRLLGSVLYRLED